MELDTFVRLYKDFLNESEQKGWIINILKEEFGNYRSSIKNIEGIEVQFFLELDLENCEKISEKTKQSNLNYGVIRQQGKGDLFAKEVMDAFHRHWIENLPKRKTSFIIYKPNK